MRSISPKVFQALTLYAAFTIGVTGATTQVAAQAANANPSAELAARIQRIENNLPPIALGENQPPLQLTLQKLMELYSVPGLSIAVVDDYKIAWAKGYGVTESGSNTPVTTKTIFQAGSISKPVAATGALYLVEHGKLLLDENVNQKLVSWKVPDNDFTKDQKVTLRRILSHSAGLTVHGFPGYEVGQPIPTLVQIFNGEKPANTAPIRVDYVPGTQTRYSGGGVTIEQQLILDVTGKPFPQFMRETVLDKIGMSDSSYEQPQPPARAVVAASGTHIDGTVVPGKWHIYPEMAAAGLWTTPTDLAKFGIEIALSKQGKSNRVLSEAMTREMLRPQIENVGLGFFLGIDKSPDRFGHDGADEGFQATLLMFSDSGHGLAIMVNSDNGITVANYLIQSVVKEYGWNYTPDTRNNASIALHAVAHFKGTQAAIDEYSILKKANPSAMDENTLVELGYHLFGLKKLPDAIQVMKLEVQEYPKFWNAYDSLGEMYMNVGEKQLAIQNYEKSIELKPDNQNGIDMLKKLRAEK
jgi:CubicO group peptidase (beta-lactamase class C family)